MVQENRLLHIIPSLLMYWKSWQCRNVYLFSGMKSAVEEYVKSCAKCFAVNPKVSCDDPPLNPIPVPARIWSLVGIDIIGPLQESSQGNKYIVAITAALPQKTAARVSDFLYTTVCRLGCMDTLISDQGREFVNSVVDHLLERMSTEHRISSAYHPCYSSY